MKQKIQLLLTGLIVLVLFACNNKNKPTETFDITAMKKIIKEKNNQFTKAHITGDTAFLNNIFTQDAKVFCTQFRRCDWTC